MHFAFHHGVLGSLSFRFPDSSIHRLSQPFRQEAMSFPLQQAQEAPPDTSAQQVADSTAADTTISATTTVDTTGTDTLTTLTQLNRDLTEAGDLLFEGELQLFLNRLYEGLAGLVVGLIPKVMGALFVFLLFYVIYRVLRTIFRRVLRRSRFIDPGLETLLLQTFRMIPMKLPRYRTWAITFFFARAR